MAQPRRPGTQTAWRPMLLIAVLLTVAPFVAARAWSPRSGPSTSARDAAPSSTSQLPPTTPRATQEDDLSAPGPSIAVASVTDGDTLRLVDGREIRLAQVDAPETNQCFGSQSTAALRDLVDGKSVTLRRPADAPAKDKYGRTLAELYVDRVSVDEALIRDGAAEWYEQFAHEDADLARRLQVAEQEARAAGRGLWSACHASPPPSKSSPAAATAPRPLVASPQPAGNCHPGYPDDCIPPAPPDLDCGDLQRVIHVDQAYGDPHNLDADGDGWGCESYG